MRRPAPQVPMRNPNTALTKPPNGNHKSDNRNDNNDNNNDNKQLRQQFDMANAREQKQQQQQEKKEQQEEMEERAAQERDGEESIYQTIWQFRTLEPLPSLEAEDDDDFEIITAGGTLSDDEAEVVGAQEDEEEVDDEDEEEEEEEGEEDNADTLTLQAAAAYAAGARHRLTKPTLATPAAATPAATPLPSPTASMDHGAWETDDEFMFEKADEASRHRHGQGQGEREGERERAETLSVGSTVTNSTATLGSISSDSSAQGVGAQGAPRQQLLQHPLLRNICIIYSTLEPQKHRAIFYEYQRAQLYQRFMTRIRRPAPPPPTAAAKAATTPAAATTTATPHNDDSGCSCEADGDGDGDGDADADGQELSQQIPQPLREEWILALLASAASSKRGGVTAGSAAGRKIRVRSNAHEMRLELVAPSVVAWRKQLQHVNCCEDEEDMVSVG